MAKEGVSTKADYMPIDDMTKLILCLREDREYFMEMVFTISLSTALRYSDLSKLCWEDMIDANGNVKNKVFVKEQKRKKTRLITLSSRTRERISFFYSMFNTSDLKKKVFSLPNYEKSISSQGLNKKLKVIAKKYGVAIDSFSTHTFRKTFGRYFWEQNNKTDYSLMLLCDIFNHSSISTTKIYLGLRDEEVSEAYEAIGDIGI